MKKTNQKSDTSNKKNLRLHKEVIRELKDADLNAIRGGIWQVHSFQSSCC